MRLPLTLLASATLWGCASDYTVVPEPPDVDPGEVLDCPFSRVGSSAFYSYDCNPVFTTTGESWAPVIGSTAFNVTEVLGHPFYQLWYVGWPESGELGRYGLGYAVSEQGTTWATHAYNPLLNEPSDGMAWNASGMQTMKVLWDPDLMQYILLYGGYNVDRKPSTWGMGVATSPDGAFWSQSPANPVFDLTVGDTKSGVANWCWPLGLKRGTVAGYTGYLAGQVQGSGSCEVYRLSASDPNTWQPDTEVVLQAEPDSWYKMGFGDLSIADLDGTWYMFFVGFGSWEVNDGYLTTQEMFLGWASSPDGSSWTVNPDPIPINQTEVGEVGSVAAHRVDDRIHLWVTDVWNEESGVGYFLYDPNRAAEEDGLE